MPTFDRLRALVQGALDRAPDERNDWLTANCGDDTALLADALELVRESELDDTFLVPPARPAALEPLRITPGTRIAEFEVVKELGRGGMGVVFEATQDTPRRRVALKVLDGGLSTRSQERFRYEVEVLGALRHPNIAQVYDAGTTGIPGALSEATWFAMEYVADARTVLKHSEHRKLDTPDRIGLFLSLCDAIQYGHQRGIVHRDIKPDNALVGEDGVLKVIDFGVARVLDPERLRASLRTQVDEVVGTLGYMSPEQASGADVDTRSDVYSLGVVLFELLTGQRPLDLQGLDLVAAASRVASTPPKRARAVNPALHRDLDAILGKALEKQPAQRYASVAALADDLRSSLRGESVSARQPSALRAVRMFAKRHKAAFAAATGVVLVSLVGAVVSMGFASDSERERSRFESLFRTQFDQSIEMITRDARDAEFLLGGEPLARRMLNGAIERLAALEPLAHDDVAVIDGIAVAYWRLASSETSGGIPESGAVQAAETALLRALAMIDRLDAEHPPSESRHRLRVRVLTDLTFHAHRSGKDVEARAQALRELPLDELEPNLRGHVHDALAMAARNRKDYAEASRHASGAIKAREGSGQHTYLGLSYGARAMAARGQRDFSAARDDYARARASLRAGEMQSMFIRARAVAMLLSRGEMFMALREPEKARADFEAGAKEARALYVEAPAHLSVLRTMAIALRRLGQIGVDTALRNPKGSDARKAGLRGALGLWAQATDILERVGAQGRHTNATRGSLRILRKMIARVEPKAQ